MIDFKQTLKNDLDNIFFNTNEFAELANFGGESIKVLFNQTHSILNNEIEVLTVTPTMVIQEKDFFDLKQKRLLTKVIIRGVTYKISESFPKNDGTYSLQLNKIGEYETRRDC